MESRAGRIDPRERSMKPCPVSRYRARARSHIGKLYILLKVHVASVACMRVHVHVRCTYMYVRIICIHEFVRTKRSIRASLSTRAYIYREIYTWFTL